MAKDLVGSAKELGIKYFLISYTDLFGTQRAKLVPASAIQQNGQASFVYVIQNNVAHMRTVKPGVTDGGVTQVDGINPGDVVANSSFDKLQDNAAVAVSNKPAPANNGGGNAP